MNAETQSLLTLFVGGAVLRLSLTDEYLRYVKDGLRPFLLAAAVILIVVGVVTLVREMVRHDERTARLLGDDHGHHGHHGHGGPRVAWLLLLPVFTIFLVSPPSLGSYAASRAASADTRPDNFHFFPLPEGDPVRVTVLDYATRASWSDGATLKGRRLLLSGFLTPRPGGGMYLTRILLSCCAADGRPVKITLVGDLPRKLKADAWVEVVGAYHGRPEIGKGGERIARLKIHTVRSIPTPDNPYKEE